MRLIDRTELGTLARSVFADLAAAGELDDPTAVMAVLGNIGLAELTRPVEFGGSGGTYAQSFELLREAGRAGAAAPLIEHDLLASWLCTAAGAEFQDGLTTVAVLDPDVDQAMRVPWARFANQYAFVRRQGERDEFLCMRSSDVHLQPGQNLAGEARDTVLLPDPNAQRQQWSPIDVGRPVAEVLTLRGAAGRLAMMAGAAVRVAELVTEHVTTREQFGRPLVKFQVVEHALARLVADTTLLQACAHSAMTIWDDQSAAPDASVHAAKAAGGKLAAAICETGHQLLGAMGTTREHELHRSTKRLWAWRDEYLTAADHAALLGALARASGDPWPIVVGE